MRGWLRAAVVACGLVFGSSAAAQEVRTFVYDAQGRVAGVARTKAGAPSGLAAYRFDDVDNRTRRDLTNIGGRAVQNELRAGEVLVPQSQLTAADGRSALVLQADGNLVLYFNGMPLWSSSTAVGRSLFLVMQGEGNLVLYSPSHEALWATGAGGIPGARAVLQNDCNLVIYDTNNVARWATHTQC